MLNRSFMFRAQTKPVSARLVRVGYTFYYPHSLGLVTKVP